MSPEIIKEIESSAQALGMLGSLESLEKKCFKDWVSLPNLGISSYVEFINAMKGVIEVARYKSQQTLFQRVAVGNLLVNCSEEKYTRCPFGVACHRGGPVSQPFNYAVQNRDNGKTIIFSDSTIHNMRHGFASNLSLEDTVSVLRLPWADPSLELRVDVSYPTVWDWRESVSASPEYCKREDRILQERASRFYKIDKWATAYIETRPKIGSEDRILQERAGRFYKIDERATAHTETLPKMENKTGHLTRCTIINHQCDQRELGPLEIEGVSMGNKFLTYHSSGYELCQKINKTPNLDWMNRFINYYSNSFSQISLTPRVDNDCESKLQEDSTLRRRIKQSKVYSFVQEPIDELRNWKKIN